MSLVQKECKIRMQLCALLSQLHRHKDALNQAKNSVKLVHLLIKDLKSLCIYYIRKQDSKDDFQPEDP